jgi:hypothetical protein
LTPVPDACNRHHPTHFSRHTAVQCALPPIRRCYDGAQEIPKENAAFAAPYQRDMTMNFTIGPLAALIAGILILIMPRLLNYIVAFYLIIIGVIGVFGVGSIQFR